MNFSTTHSRDDVLCSWLNGVRGLLKYVTQVTVASNKHPQDTEEAPKGALTLSDCVRKVSWSMNRSLEITNILENRRKLPRVCLSCCKEFK